MGQRRTQREHPVAWSTHKLANLPLWNSPNTVTNESLHRVRGHSEEPLCFVIIGEWDNKISVMINDRYGEKPTSPKIQVQDNIQKHDKSRLPTPQTRTSRFEQEESVHFKTQVHTFERNFATENSKVNKISFNLNFSAYLPKVAGTWCHVGSHRNTIYHKAEDRMKSALQAPKTWKKIDPEKRIIRVSNLLK